MSKSKQYLNDLFKRVVDRNPNEPEFHQTVKEVLDSLEGVVERHPEYIELGILERIVEPERTLARLE